MAHSTRSLTTATSSSSTLTILRNANSQLLKYQVENALEHSRAGLPSIPYLDFASPMIEAELEENYDLTLTKAENQALLWLFLLGFHFDCSDAQPNLNLHNH